MADDGWEDVTDPSEMKKVLGVAGMNKAIGGGGMMGSRSAPSDDVRSRVQMQTLGLPVLRSQLDPFQRITDPKQRAVMQQRLGTMAQKYLDADQPHVDQARSGLRDLDEYSDILAKNRSSFGTWSTAAATHLPAFAQPDWLTRADALSTQMARGQRQPGEGTISDFDARQFGKMVGGVGQSPEANDRFIAANRAAKQSLIDHHDFLEAFVQANGTTQGADRAWRQYTNDEPIFAKDGTLRDKRRGWSDYFSQRAQNKLAGKPANASAATAGGFQVVR